LGSSDKATYESGSGSDTLVFTGRLQSTPTPIDFKISGGAIIATEAAAALRAVDFSSP
jgi:hypothetical protein